ncbi:MAG: hypothetical protein ACYSTL_05900 [Planctomycetota bacterium]
MTTRLPGNILLITCLLGLTGLIRAEDVEVPGADTWITVTGQAGGTDLSAQDEAIANALRKAVEQACGTFLTSQSKSRDYKLVYEKIFANTVGYVIEHKDPKIFVQDGITHAKVTARVLAQKFEKDWAVIAHTVHQEGNPRVIIAVTEASWPTTRPIEKTEWSERSLIAGVVQGKLEEFFLAKGLQLMDRDIAVKVNKRDIILAGLKDDIRELAALGARFKADVVIYGQAAARYGNTVRIADHDAHKFVATLNVRAVRTDSGQLIVSKTFGPVIKTSLQYGGAREKALAKLAEESAPKLLDAVIEAWRKQVNVARDIQLSISGMDYDTWQKFREEAGSMRGVRALDLKEITEGVANITVKFEYDTQILADKLTKLKSTDLKVTEFNPNRLKLKVTNIGE